MSLDQLIAEALANPPIHPTVGPRLGGLTLTDLIIRAQSEGELRIKVTLTKD